ncbi:MAG: 5'/3'-nucleotidase SurE [Planctomycetaceae bacterium]
MNFLITNDDGFDAPGLAALYCALKPLGDVTVVAPSVCHSAKGHAVNTKSLLEVEHRVVAPFGPTHIVNSSPADCVRIGLRGLLAEPPDFVVAGINTGANLGVDLFYSGTAAAAREAAILGVPAIALSRYLQLGNDVNWENLSRHVTRVVEQLVKAPHLLPPGEFWNVNFPAVPGDEHSQDIKFAAMNLLSHDVRFEEVERDGDVTRYRYSGEFRERGKDGVCDVSWVFRGHITATPIHLCNTARRSMFTDD